MITSKTCREVWIIQDDSIVEPGLWLEPNEQTTKVHLKLRVILLSHLGRVSVGEVGKHLFRFGLEAASKPDMKKVSVIAAMKSALLRQASMATTLTPLTTTLARVCWEAAEACGSGESAAC
jgi:hypothetical protein